MPRLFVSRLLDTFFKRWWLYLLPVVLFGALGAVTVTQQSTSYRSTGVIRVSGETLLTEITAIRGGQSPFGFETPATYTAREINTVLGTDLFLRSVIEEADLMTAVQTGAITMLELRESIWAAPEGDLLVQINAATDDADVSYRLAAATIESYHLWQIDDNVTESRSAEMFFESLLGPSEAELDEASVRLAEYIRTHPSPGGDETLRPLDEQIEIARLSEIVDRASDRLATVTQSLADARLATAQTATDVEQRLRTVDAPQVPTAPESSLRRDAMTLALFLALGGLVSMAALALGTASDRTVRYPEEVEHHLRLPVVAALPESRTVAGTPGL